MKNFFKKLFGGGSGRGRELEAVRYHEDTSTPCPRKIGVGRSTEAVIRKRDGENLREHFFIRADTCNNEAGAVELILNKAQALIDQQGDKIFS